jgi:hypothetical protein
MAKHLATLGWHAFIQQQRQSSIHPAISQAPHPTTPYLHSLIIAGGICQGSPFLMLRYRALIRLIFASTFGT